MRKLLICAGVLLCAASWGWTAEKQEQTLSGGTYNAGYVLDAETADKTDSTQNTLIINGGSYKEQVIAGRSEKGKATSNILTINQATLQTKQAAAGVSQNEAAQANELTVQNITTASGLVGGWAQQEGQALENKVTLNGTQVEADSAEVKWVRGGQTKTGQAQKNQVNLLGGAVVKTNVAAGLSESGEVSYNTLTVDGGSKLLNGGIGNAVYGGYSKDGTAHHNQISLLSAGEVAVNAYGGYSATSQANYNLIETQAAQTTGHLYGGYSESGAAASNEVRIGAQSSVSGTVAGGWTNTNGTAGKNKVSVAAGATVSNTAKLYGGYSKQGSALSNTLVLKSEKIGAEAYGGYAATGEAQGNLLQVTGATFGSQLGGALAGTAAVGNTLRIENSAWATPGFLFGGTGGTDAKANKLYITNSNLNGYFFGGQAHSDAAEANGLYITNSTLTGDFIGGLAAGGQALNNSVVVNNSSLSGDVRGGSAASVAKGNYVELNSVAVNGKVYAGYSDDASQETSHNTLVLSGNTTATGGFFGGNGVSSGNALLLRNYQNNHLTVDSSFDKVTLYGLGSNVTFANEVPNGVDVVLYGKPSEMSQTLAHTQSGTALTLNRDILGVYRYSIAGTPAGSLVDWSVQGKYENQLAKPYAQAQLAGLALTGLGDDMLDTVFNEARQEKSDNDMFAGVRYYDNTYKTGSSLDMQSIGVQAGRWFRSGEKVWGLFGQYVRGHYSTDPMDATGSIDSFGVGGFALLPYSEEGYFEAVLRAGYQSQDFNSDDLSSDVKSKHFYGHASAGLVQKISALRLYGKLGGSYLLGDKVTDNLGQSVKFQDTQSLQGTVGARWNLGTLARHYQPYIGIAGIYELVADSQVKVDGHKVTGADLKGASGRAEAGVSYENNSAMMPFKSVLSVFGQAGRVQGWGADIKLLFSF